MLKCKNCGSESDDNSKFCGSCGQAFEIQEVSEEIETGKVIVESQPAEAVADASPETYHEAEATQEPAESVFYQSVDSNDDTAWVKEEKRKSIKRVLLPIVLIAAALAVIAVAVTALFNRTFFTSMFKSDAEYLFSLEATELENTTTKLETALLAAGNKAKELGAYDFDYTLEVGGETVAVSGQLDLTNKYFDIIAKMADIELPFKYDGEFLLVDLSAFEQGKYYIPLEISDLDKIETFELTDAEKKHFRNVYYKDIILEELNKNAETSKEKNEDLGFSANCITLTIDEDSVETIVGKVCEKLVDDDVFDKLIDRYYEFYIKDIEKAFKNSDETIGIIGGVDIPAFGSEEYYKIKAELYDTLSSAAKYIGEIGDFEIRYKLYYTGNERILSRQLRLAVEESKLDIRFDSLKNEQYFVMKADSETLLSVKNTYTDEAYKKDGVSGVQYKGTITIKSSSRYYGLSEGIKIDYDLGFEGEIWHIPAGTVEVKYGDDTVKLVTEKTGDDTYRSVLSGETFDEIIFTQRAKKLGSMPKPGINTDEATLIDIFDQNGLMDIIEDILYPDSYPDYSWEDTSSDYSDPEDPMEAYQEMFGIFFDTLDDYVSDSLQLTYTNYFYSTIDDDSMRDIYDYNGLDAYFTDYDEFCEIADSYVSATEYYLNFPDEFLRDFYVNPLEDYYYDYSYSTESLSLEEFMIEYFTFDVIDTIYESMLYLFFPDASSVTEALGDLTGYNFFSSDT